MLLFLFSVIRALGVGRTVVVLDVMEEIAMETGWCGGKGCLFVSGKQRKTGFSFLKL